MNARVPRSHGSFHALENRLTSLGSIVYQPRDGRVMRSDDLGGTWHLDRASSIEASDIPDELTGRDSAI